MVDIVQANTDDMEAICAFLNSCDQSLIYTHPRYLSLISQHLGCHYSILLAKSGREIKGILPYLSKDGDFGLVYNSLPYYGSNGGVVQREFDELSFKALIDIYFQIAKQSGAVSATIINNPLLQDKRCYEQWADHDFVDTRIGQITPLPAAEELLIQQFDSPRPRNIKKALKNNVVVKSSQDESSIRFLYDTHVENMNAINGLAKQRSFFELLPSVMESGDWSIYIGEIDQSPVAALLVLYHNNTVEYFTPVIKAEHRQAQALSLVIYEAMKDSIRKGFQYWNWGGTWLSQDGVYNFKKKWGTQDLPYFYYTKLFNQSVKTRGARELLDAYPGFYVLPFSALEESKCPNS